MCTGMSGPELVLAVSAGVGILAWLGVWAELLLLWGFNPWYFATGPVVARFTRKAPACLDQECLSMRLRGLGHVSAKVLGPWTVLVRPRSPVWPFPWDVPQVWSPRLRVQLCQKEDRRVLELEARHSFSWPVFLAVPALGASYMVTASPLVHMLVFWLICLLVAVVPLIVSVRHTRRYAARLWGELTRSAQSNNAQGCEIRPFAQGGQ